MRKPTGGSLFLSGLPAGTNKPAARGLVAACPQLVTVLALLLSLAVLVAPARAEVGLGFSADFTVDTTFPGSRGADVSGLFTVDTRYEFNTGANVSGLFRVDTRYSGSLGHGDSGIFTVDTITAAQPSVLVSGRVTSGGIGLAGATVSALFFNRVQASALTDGNGYYTLPLLPPGTYDFRAVRSSYAPGLTRAVALPADTAATVNLALGQQAAPPTVVPVSQAPPAVPQLPVTPAQLKVWNGSAFVSGLSLQPDRTTVVMTHGWNSSLNAWAADMAQRMSTALAAAGKQANLTGWDWEDAADSLLGQAASRTQDQGRGLGIALINSLPDNDQPVHFIGHSLGSLVNARAADYLQYLDPFDFPGSRIHVTVLDNGTLANTLRPLSPALLALAWQGNAAFDAGSSLLLDGLWVSPFPKDVAWIDNYVSLVGVSSRSAVNVYLTEGGRFSDGRFGWGFVWQIPISLHAYSYEWYGDTVSQPFNSVLGHRYSFERQGAGANFAHAAGSRFEQDSTANPFSLRQLGDSELTAAQARIAAASVVTVASGFGTIVGNGVQAVGNVVSSVTSKTLGLLDEILETGAVAIESVPRVNLTTGPLGAFPLAKGGAAQLGGGLSNSPAYVWFQMAVPSNATQLTFDYELSGDPKEDCLAFAINSSNQFALAAQHIPEGVMQTSTFIDVTAWAGQTVEFFFGVTGGTSTNATLTVDGLRFYSLQPPRLLAQKTVAQQMVLNWPLSAGDYLLERTSGVGGSNGWTVVTNLPAVESFQFALTNTAGASNEFFRLRKP